MFLINKKPLGYFFVCVLSIASACSSKKSESVAGSGGESGFHAGTGGANTVAAFDQETYCNGLFKGQTCSSTRLEADIKTVNMLLVIDESNSMNSKASDTATDPKWIELKRALRAALTVRAVQDNINFGLELFPYDPNGISASDSASSCSVPTGVDAINVPVAPGASNLKNIFDFLDNQTPAGGTPTRNALAEAFTYFTEGAGTDALGTNWVLLATDGGPNCNPALTCDKETCTQNMDLKCADGSPTTTTNCCGSTYGADANLGCLDDTAVVSQINKLALAGVDTYVIGIPGSEAYGATLDKMAEAGKKPNPAGAHGEKYYAVSAANSLKDLQTAFEEITSKLVTSCDIVLSQSPAQPSLVQVAQDCDLIPMLPGNQPPGDAGTVDGFFVDYRDDGAHLILTGSYCDRISTVGAKNLDVIVGCKRPD
jgi:hypothetical protein